MSEDDPVKTIRTELQRFKDDQSGIATETKVHLTKIEGHTKAIASAVVDLKDKSLAHGKALKEHEEKDDTRFYKVEKNLWMIIGVFLFLSVAVPIVVAWWVSSSEAVSSKAISKKLDVLIQNTKQER